MSWSTFFTQVLTTLGFYSPIVPPIAPPPHLIFPLASAPHFPIANGPIIPLNTNGPIIPLVNPSSQDCDDDYVEDLVRLSTEKCGLPMNITKMLSTKIIGGSEARISDYPWQVSLQRRSGFGLSHFCGGTLIHPKWVITAGHCLEWTLSGKYVRPDAVSRIRVIAGTQTISASTNSQSYSASKVVINPSYDIRRAFNDIALISLQTPIKSLAENSLAINTICLPSNQNQVIANKLTTTGWGTTQENGRNSYNLRSVVLPLVSSNECKQMYGRGFSVDSMICAGSEGKDSCQGDSGGGLIQTDKTGRATIVGIVSVGNGCGRRGYPGIYTKVSHFIDWINRVINSQ